jgi:hypothetical protein
MAFAAAGLALALAGCDAVTEYITGDMSCDDSSDAWTYRCADGDVVERCTSFGTDSYLWLEVTWCKYFKDGHYHCEENAGDRCATVPDDACCVPDAPAG